ncbi:class F sortase, partial [Angustibacter aerolatus]
APGAAPPGVAAEPLPAPDATAGAVPAGAQPVELRIPRIGVRTSLEHLGISADGSIEVPRDPDRAGWLDVGPAPGQRGPAVIAGHVDSSTAPAVFFRLRELRPGDEVQVLLAGGRVVRFTVDEVQQYAKSRFPTADVYGPVPGPVLRLITCGGTFDRAQGHYRDNLVVYAS